MASIHKDIPINAPARDVWDAVRDFGALHTRLVPGFVLDTRLDGEARIVSFANGTVAREILVDVPDEQLSRLPMHNIIPRLSSTPGQLRRPAPALGEHTAEVLSSLGLDHAEIDGLARDGVIGLAGDMA